jgi:hypothetical protein
MKNPKCCEVESVWVENVPGKGYYYCKDCKNEVKEPDHTTNIPQWHYSDDKGWYTTDNKNTPDSSYSFDWNMMQLVPDAINILDSNFTSGDETEEG